MRNSLWRYSYRVLFTSSLTLALSGIPMSAKAQQTTNPTMSTSGAATAQAQAQTQAQANPNPDLTTQEVARMDQFLDDHKDVDKQLQSNPALINDQKYLDHHKDLETFLNAHPRVREEFAENPTYFMHREDRFEGSQMDRDRYVAGNIGQNAGAGQNGGATGNTGANANTGQYPRNPNSDLTNGEVTNFDGFLDSHPEVARQLEDNPALINDPNYLKANPQLQDYLSQHPGVREEVTETPSYFMRREERLEARNDERPNPGVAVGVGANVGVGATDQQAARFDQFLDDHKDVAKDLRNKPSLCNDDKYIHHHRDFEAFLNANPDIHRNLADNPSFFFDRDRFAGNRELTRGQALKMDAFLDRHQDVAKDLHNRPSLCNDDKYVSHHKDLRDFYAQNPGMRTQLAQSQSYFHDRDLRLEQHQMTQPKTTQPKTTPPQTTPAKTPAEQRQDATPTTPH